MNSSTYIMNALDVAKQKADEILDTKYNILLKLLNKLLVNMNKPEIINLIFRMIQPYDDPKTYKCCNGHGMQAHFYFHVEYKSQVQNLNCCLDFGAG